MGSSVDAFTYWRREQEPIDHLQVLFDLAAYMDDLAIPIIDNAVGMVKKSVRAFEISDSVFARYSFELNYKVGKYNAIMRVAGPGAKQALFDLADDHFQLT